MAAPEGTNVTILVDDDRYTFDQAGRIAHVGHVVYKVLTQKGAEGWDSLSADWAPWHEARPAIRVRVIAPDFSVHELDPKAMTEAPTREGDYKSTATARRCARPFPPSPPAWWSRRSTSKPKPSPSLLRGRVDQVSFGREQVPVAHSSVLFDAPASLPLHFGYLLLPDLKPVRTEADGRVTVAYELGPLEGVEPREPNLPPDAARFPEIWFSTGVSWQAIAAAYGKIVDDHAAPAPVQPIVEKLIAGKKTTTEKEEAILDYLDREVRYTGIEFGEAALVPHDPAETLSHKYGDCKDKAALLVTMLRAAGIPSYVALLNAGSRMDVPADLPGLGAFDHAIVYVPEDPKHKEPALWIDCHRPLCAAGAVARGRSGPAGADRARGNHRAGQDAGGHIEGQCAGGASRNRPSGKRPGQRVGDYPAHGGLRVELPLLLCGQTRQGNQKGLIDYVKSQYDSREADQG